MGRSEIKSKKKFQNITLGMWQILCFFVFTMTLNNNLALNQ